MVERLLEAAEDLLRRRGKSSAARRRAVSTAYYAVFHRLAKLGAETIVVGASVDSPEYLRVYRALQHGAAKQAFADKELKANVTVKTIGETFAQLQSSREKADYYPPLQTLFSIDECEELIGQARKACETIDNLTEVERRLIVTLLLFKARKP